MHMVRVVYVASEEHTNLIPIHKNTWSGGAASITGGLGRAKSSMLM